MSQAKTHKFEIIIGSPPEHTKSEFVGTIGQAKAHIAEQFDGATCVLRGYTTYRIYLRGRAIGSMQST